VAYLLPFIEEEKAGGESTSAGKILLATVKVMFTILVKISFR
jgi:5-methyltetrahydrofolate--homocysteine methyltransferase